LIGMGILPIEIKTRVFSENKLDGSELFSLEGLEKNLIPLQEISIVARRLDGSEIKIPARILLQTPIEIEYYRHGGILQYTLRKLRSLVSDISFG
jgi:aconitate hydratase